MTKIDVVCSRCSETKRVIRNGHSSSGAQLYRCKHCLKTFLCWGGIIGGVIYSDSIPMHQYVIVLLIGVGLISLLNAISKHYHIFRSVTIGNPIPIIKNGRFVMENIMTKQNKIDILNLSSQLHAQGIHAFQEINYAQIEPDGQVTVVCEGHRLPSVIVMKDGKPRTYELKEIDKDEAWLKQEIKAHQIAPEDIFIAEFWDGRIVFILNDGRVIK